MYSCSGQTAMMSDTCRAMGVSVLRMRSTCSWLSGTFRVTSMGTRVMLMPDFQTIWVAKVSLFRLYSSTGERAMPFSSTMGTMTPPMMMSSLASLATSGSLMRAAATLVTVPVVMMVTSPGY